MLYTSLGEEPANPNNMSLPEMFSFFVALSRLIFLIIISGVELKFFVLGIY